MGSKPPLRRARRRGRANKSSYGSLNIARPWPQGPKSDCALNIGGRAYRDLGGANRSYRPLSIYISTGIKLGGWAQGSQLRTHVPGSCNPFRRNTGTVVLGTGRKLVSSNALADEVGSHIHPAHSVPNKVPDTTWAGGTKPSHASQAADD